MSVDHEPDPPVEEPRFRVPFSDTDRDLLEERVPHLLGLLDDALDVRESASGHRLLGARETLAGLRALEVIRRLVEAMSTELLAHYRRTGDSTAHGYRSTDQLLAGEFRITSGEARRRMKLSEDLVSRISDVGEELEAVRPAIAAEFADGRISADEAKALCDAVEDLPPTIRTMYADRVEKTLVEMAPTVTLKDVPKLGQRIIQNIDPDGKFPQHEPDPHKYNVTLSQQRSGDWRLRGLLDCQTGTTFHALLYGRMKDADIPVAVRPHRECNTDGSPVDPADGPTTHGQKTSDQSTRGQSTRGQSTRGQSTRDQSTRDQSTRGQYASAQPQSRLSEPPVLDDADDYSMTDANGVDTNGEDAIPQVPLEAMWEDTCITVHSDATIQLTGRGPLSGRTGTFIQEEPRFYLDESGWAVLMSERVSEEAQKLLAEAQTAEAGVATSVVWEKILGRAPTHGVQDPEEESASAQPEQETAVVHQVDGSTSEYSGEDPGDLQHSDTSTFEHPGEGSVFDQRPVAASTTEGVFEDGNRSAHRIDETMGNAPGLARHDRFAFLLRSVARERVLHGADHALVVTATVDDLTRPNALLSTHAGAPTTLQNLERWSNAAQTFVHITDGGGRSIEVRSRGRFATRTQMAVLAARDQGCTFPDCDAPAEWCEAHHIVAYARGGKTEIDNLTLVCPFHHRWFERSGWDSRFVRGFPAWQPPKSFDPRQRTVFHSRFRVALLGLPPELPLGA